VTAPCGIPTESDVVRDVFFVLQDLCVLKNDGSILCTNTWTLPGSVGYGVAPEPGPRLRSVSAPHNDKIRCGVTLDDDFGCYRVDWFKRGEIHVGPWLSIARGHEIVAHDADWFLDRGGALSFFSLEDTLVGPLVLERAPARFALAGVVEAAAGDGHRCARTGDDGIWCWGYSTTNGALGTHGTADGRAARIEFSAP
jgi:hypothetical protein